MGKNSRIQWTDHTFNPWIGCQKVSEGCDHCYAMDSTFVRVQRSEGRELWGNQLRSERHVTSDANWRKPVQWNRQAEADGRRARVFCASLADVFEDHPDLEEPRARLWDLIEDTPSLEWQLLTKRPENVMAMVPAEWEERLPPNVWVGVSAENQERANERIPKLLRVPARVRFVSAEPLIGPVNLRKVVWEVDDTDGIVHDALTGTSQLLPGRDFGFTVKGGPTVDWVIVGGESGPEARPASLAWMEHLVEQCQDTGTPCFVKQLGARPYYVTPEGREFLGLEDRKGGDEAEWPRDLRFREFPESVARETVSAPEVTP